MSALEIIWKLLKLIVRHGNKKVCYSTAPYGEFDDINKIVYHRKEKGANYPYNEDCFYIDG